MSRKSSKQPTWFLPKTITPARKIYYLRMVFAVAAGIFCGLIGFRGSTGILAAIAFYIWSYAFVKHTVGKELTSPEDRKKLYKAGIFSYIFLWLAIWILVYNLAIHV